MKMNFVEQDKRPEGVHSYEPECDAVRRRRAFGYKRPYPFAQGHSESLLSSRLSSPRLIASRLLTSVSFNVQGAQAQD